MLDFSVDNVGRPQLSHDGRVWVYDLGISIFHAGEFLRDTSDEITGQEWQTETGHDRMGEFRTYHRAYFYENEPLLSVEIRLYSDLMRFDVMLSHDLAGISRGDSFTTPGVLLPRFSFSQALSFFLSTFGLGGEGDGYPGGYWPTAKIGHGPHELPDEAFAPIVLYDETGALAIAPGNFFLTSPLVKTEGGVGRGLHGAVDFLPAGTQLETVFAFGKDVPAALLHLGDYLLARSGKSRPTSDSHPLFSRLGWWNAYGGYYTEPIRKLDANGLAAVMKELQANQLPLGYVGLDLWYLYERIGQAIRYVPDPEKYPNGIGKIAQDAGVSTVLHLSALSKKNAYGADGTDPGFYREVAKDLTHERAIVAWHDWLRTQQHITPKLRTDPSIAEHWFSGMADAFKAEGLNILLCMQTMGMNLAATQLPNIIAGRTHTDYLFSQPEALATAARQGHPEFLDGAIPARELHRQNMLMGMVLYSLGIMPFHDLFLSQPHSGLGGDHAEEEAVLRALSGGPVGIGDGPGMTDPNLIKQLLLPDGTLAHPDHPPVPIWSTVEDDVQAFFTEHQAGDATWGYLVLLNASEHIASFALDPPISGDFLFWDGINQRKTSRLQGTIPPGRIAYFVLVPQRAGIAPLGLWGQFVPAAAGGVEGAVWNSGWQLQVSPSPVPIAVLSDGPIKARAGNDRSLGVEKKNGVWLVDSGMSVDQVHIYRR